MYRGANGLLLQSVTNAPRVEYDGATIGTNYTLQSQDWSASQRVFTESSAQSNVTFAPDGTLTLYLPELGGADVEVFILLRSAVIAPETLAAMRLQEQSGFARQVLGDLAEDIWNDI